MQGSGVRTRTCRYHLSEHARGRAPAHGDEEGTDGTEGSEAAEKDPQLRKYFKQPAVAKVVQQNNPRRESNLGWIEDRFYKKSTLREYNTLRNEAWQGGHSKELVAGHSLDWPKQFGGIESKRSTIEEQGSNRREHTLLTQVRPPLSRTLSLSRLHPVARAACRLIGEALPGVPAPSTLAGMGCGLNRPLSSLCGLRT